MNLAERIAQLDEPEITTQLITTIEECDIPEPNVKNLRDKKQIGFSI